MDTLTVYYEALERLRIKKTVVVGKSSRITNDAVSLEAGRKKGSIKKSRPMFHELIAAIDAAAAEQASPLQDQVEKINKAKLTVENLQSQLDQSLAREMSLLSELFETKKQLSKLTGAKIFPIRKMVVK